ncbi:MAG TPA: hypothetical protein VNF72_07075 [Myxococcota bacterium]|nr:hypothetical protein [Myxococcota bacterium]
MRSRHTRILVFALGALALLGFVALRLTALRRVAFNWDELVLFESITQTARDGIFRSHGRPGLTQLVLAPLVAACQDEIATGRAARNLWLGVTWLYLAGIAALLAEVLRGSARRAHDIALGVALLGLLPVFLEWSLQVRTDQLALAGGAWGGVALLASQRRPSLALAAGAALAIGWLSSQKLAYVGALVGVLAIVRLVETGWQPRRELARAAFVGAGASSVWLAFRTLLSSRYEVMPGHPARDVLPAPLLRAQLDAFDFYRGTIGWSQYVDILPTLVPHFALLAALVAVSVLSLRRGAREPRLLAAWLVLATGLAVGVFHAGAFSYFWMTLGLFPAVALALAAEPIRRELFAGRPLQLRVAAALLWGVVAIQGSVALVRQLEDTQAVQRESIEFVHRNFGGGQMGFHPEAGLFCEPTSPLGSWLSFAIYRQFGTERREESVDSFERTFRKVPIRYLVESFRLGQFPPELREFWAANYQPYRASVYIAGRRLRGARGAEESFELIVPGAYRWIPVGVPAAIRVGDRVLQPGEVTDFEAGPHIARFEQDVPDGALVLAVNEPPRDAPRAFYKAY